MKHALILAATLLATTAARADDILEIARYKAASVTLSARLCPEDPSQRLAVFVPRGDAPSYGCWVKRGQWVRIDWFKINNDRRPLSDHYPVADFDSAQ